MRAAALRYALAPACVLLAVLAQLSPAGVALPLGGFFVFAVLGAAWFGGAGPGLLAAVLATFTLPQLIAVNYPLLGGFLDVPRFITFSVEALAVGWWSFRRRQVEAALRESERRYALVVNASDEAFWDWKPAGDELYLSPRFLEMFDFPPGTTFAGREEFFERWALVPEDREALKRAIAEHFAGKTERMEFEFRALVRGGIRWIHATGCVTRDAEGQVARWNGAFRDVTAHRAAEQAVRESEERYARAVDGAGFGHWDWNILTDELFISDRSREILGLPAGPLPKTRTEFMKVMPQPLDDPAALKAAVEAAISSGTYERDYRIAPRSGPVRWLRSRGKVFKDAGGTAIRMTGSVTDITEAKRAEHALLESEGRYALAMEAAGDGHTDWNLLTGEHYISPRLLQICGYSPETTFGDRAEWVRRFPFHPEDRPKWEQAVAAHFAGRESHFKMELRIVVRGEVRWTAFHFLSTRDADGRPIRWTGSIGDITEQKRVEEQLRESEERFALAVAGSYDGVWDIDFVARSVFISARARELVGLPHGPETVTLDEFSAALPIHPEDAPRRLAAMQAHFSGEAPAYEGEFRLRQPDGVYRWRRLHGVCVRGAGGKPLRIAGSITDVDDRRRAEDALRESEERYERVVAATEAGFWDWDIAQDKYYVSPRLLEMAGLPPDTTIADRADFQARVPVHPEDLAKWQREMQALFAGGASRLSTELRLMLAAGTRWVRLDGMCFRDAAGKVVRWTGSAIDVTPRKLAEEALRESEERYERAMDSSEVGYWDWIPAVDKIYTSPRLLEIYGLAPGTTFAGRNDLLARIPWHADDRPMIMRSYAEHIAGKTPRYNVEIRFFRDGETRWAYLTGIAKRDPSGALVRWTGTARDVTERKRSELALWQSEERYELAMAASESGYWDWDIATNKYFASPKAYELGGYEPGEWVTRDDFRARANMHPEDFAKWEAAREELFAGTGERLAMECRYLVRGETRWHSLQAICKRDDTGKVVRWAGSTTDITERKLAEEALRESEQRYELAMAASESGYWDWDVPTGRYFTSPRAFELAGYPPGTTWATRDDYRANINMHPEDLVRWEAAREALFAGTGERMAMEVRYMVGGEPRWHMLNAICRRDQTGKVVRWAGSATDITERKRAEEGLKTLERKLRQAQRLEAMGTLAGGIAHDFNNILGAVLGYGEMALRDAPNGSRIARDLKKIMIAGERGRALVDRVLAFSRSAIGERVPVHVERVVREALDLVSAKLPPRVTVHARLNAGQAAVLADATQVHQVVANLATNAIQAMPAGGTLRVELALERVEASRAATIGGRTAGEYLVLTVADTGAGIAAEIIDRIFDPYFTTKEVGTGTGLGLSLVHGIVTDLDGAIDVASTPGSGSTFTVYLPRSGDAAEPGAEKASALPRGDGQRVLVVDDEEPLMELATRTLEELGYSPVGFTSSSAALAAFRDDPQRFDALITDERMPGISGSALIREVRGIRASLPVVLVSGYLAATAHKVTLPIAADEVLQKPLSARELAASLARVLRP